MTDWNDILGGIITGIIIGMLIGIFSSSYTYSVEKDSMMNKAYDLGCAEFSNKTHKLEWKEKP